jgi:hypothetical protein
VSEAPEWMNGQIDPNTHAIKPKYLGIGMIDHFSYQITRSGIHSTNSVTI